MHGTGRDTRRRGGGRRAATTVLALAATVALAGCSDPALVDRVAAMERSQDQLRASLRELGAPDTDAIAARDALAGDVATLEQQLAALEGRLTAATEELATLTAALDEVRTSVATASQEDDERLTALESRIGQLGALGESITALEGDLAALTDRTSSVEVQLDVHVDDPGAHTGAPASQ